MRRALLVPLALAALLALELLLLPPRLAATPGTLFEVHVEANRGTEPRRFEAGDVRRFLSSPEPLRRDFAMTWDLTRAAGAELQRAHLEELGETAEAAIGRFFLRYQVRSPDLAALRGYWTALAERPEGAAER